jgi:hypothetical protein
MANNTSTPAQPSAASTSKPITDPPIHHPQIPQSPLLSVEQLQELYRQNPAALLGGFNPALSLHNMQTLLSTAGAVKSTMAPPVTAPLSLNTNPASAKFLLPGQPTPHPAFLDPNTAQLFFPPPPQPHAAGFGPQFLGNSALIRAALQQQQAAAAAAANVGHMPPGFGPGHHWPASFDSGSQGLVQVAKVNEGEEKAVNVEGEKKFLWRKKFL